MCNWTHRAWPKLTGGSGCQRPHQVTAISTWPTAADKYWPVNCVTVVGPMSVPARGLLYGLFKEKHEFWYGIVCCYRLLVLHGIDGRWMNMYGHWWADNDMKNFRTSRKTCHSATVQTTYVSRGVVGTRRHFEGMATAARTIGKDRRQ